MQSAATRRARHRAWLVTCHSNISKIDGVLAKKSARVAATIFQEEAFISGLLLENSLERSSQNTDEMEVQSEPKINKKWAKNRPQEGYPIGSGAPWRALGRLLSMEL